MTKKNKKILFALPNLLGGGAERVIVNIINQLNVEYFDIYLILINDKGNLKSSITTKLKIINLNITRTRYSLFKIINKINLINPDIIFSTTHRMNISILISSIFTKNSAKIFVREPNMPSLLIKNNNLSYLNLFLIKFFYKRAYKIVAQTDEMNYDIVKTYNISKNQVITIHNPIDYDNINKSILKIENPFNPKFINIVASGRISKQKSYDVLIKAFRLVSDKNDNFRLYILGADSEKLKTNLINLAKELKIDKKIFFKGFVKNPYKYYRYADLFVLSSQYEGFPNVVIENLYLEKPIICTKSIPYLSQLIIDGENGFLVPVNDHKTFASKILRYKELKPLNTYSFHNINEILSRYE